MSAICLSSQATDEVGLARMSGQLQSFTAIGFSSSSSVRPVTALLAAVAGSPKPHLAELQLGAQEVRNCNAPGHMTCSCRL
jgi:hypothetical protein